MMSGEGPFGSLEMGGMFTVVKVRDGLSPDVWQVPGWYEHPAGSMAREWEGERPPEVRAPEAPAGDGAVQVIRPGRAGSHEGH
jgi:hypothetical protein